MKKTYIAPGLEAFQLNIPMLCLSKGADEDNGIADSKRFWGNSFWEEDDNEEEDDLI